MLLFYQVTPLVYLDMLYLLFLLLYKNTNNIEVGQLQHLYSYKILYYLLLIYIFN